MTHIFSKPLNPILGETFCARLVDGTMVYGEQTCHKPPISHLLFEGPDDLYVMDFYTGFSVKAYPNSVKLNVLGRKKVKFQDGGEIEWANSGDIFSNIFMGTMGH